jgi:hypothetical protein
VDVPAPGVPGVGAHTLSRTNSLDLACPEYNPPPPAT